MAHTSRRRAGRQNDLGGHADRCHGRPPEADPGAAFNAAVEEASARSRDETDAADLLALGLCWWWLTGDPEVPMDAVSLMVGGALDEYDLDDVAYVAFSARSAWIGELDRSEAGRSFLASVSSAVAGALDEDTPAAVDVGNFARLWEALRAVQLVVPPGLHPLEVLYRDPVEIPEPDEDAYKLFCAMVGAEVGELLERTVGDALRLAATVAYTALRDQVDGLSVAEALEALELPRLLTNATALLVSDGEAFHIPGPAPSVAASGGPLADAYEIALTLEAEGAGFAESTAVLLAADCVSEAIPAHSTAWSLAPLDGCVARIATSVGGIDRFISAESTTVRLSPLASAALDAQLEQREAELGRPLRDDDLIFGAAVPSPADLLAGLGVTGPVLDACDATGYLPAPFGVEVDPARTTELLAEVIDFGGTAEHLEHAQDLVGLSTIALTARTIAFENLELGQQLVAEFRTAPRTVEAEVFRAGGQVITPIMGDLVDNAATWARRLGTVDLAAAVRDAHADGTIGDPAVSLCYLCAMVGAAAA